MCDLSQPVKTEDGVRESQGTNNITLHGYNQQWWDNAVAMYNSLHGTTKPSPNLQLLAVVPIQEFFGYHDEVYGVLTFWEARPDLRKLLLG